MAEANPDLPGLIIGGAMVSVILGISAWGAVMAVRGQREDRRKMVMIRDVLRQLTPNEARKSIDAWLARTTALQVEPATPATPHPFATRLAPGLHGFFERYAALTDCEGFALGAAMVQPLAGNAGYLRIGQESDTVTMAVKPHEETVYQFDGHRLCADVWYPSVFHYLLSTALYLDEVTADDLIPGYQPPARRRPGD